MKNNTNIITTNRYSTSSTIRIIAKKRTKTFLSYGYLSEKNIIKKKVCTQGKLGSHFLEELKV